MKLIFIKILYYRSDEDTGICSDNKDSLESTVTFTIKE
jgi:hypothetical protein